jgi:hypothetical protein
VPIFNDVRDGARTSTSAPLARDADPGELRDAVDDLLRVLTADDLAIDEKQSEIMHERRQPRRPTARAA